MDSNTIIPLFVGVNCLIGLAVTFRLREGVRGYVILYLTALLASATGAILKQSALTWLGASVWAVLIVVPGFIAMIHSRRILQQQYPAAYRLARIIRCLHPADGWRQQPEILRALMLAQRNELPEALEILKRYEDHQTPIGMSAIVTFYRVSGQWEEFLAWRARNSQRFDRYPLMLSVWLRALGETGDLRGLIELYSQRRDKIAKMIPVEQRGLCHLVLFAFGGRRGAVEQLFRGSLRTIPLRIQKFWLATADLAAGQTEPARQQLQSLLPDADSSMRIAIERRLAQIDSPPEQPDASAEALDRAESELSQDERFGVVPVLWTAKARGTQILIGLNLVMFVVEIFSGGGSNLGTLYQLGAMHAPAVRNGEWWRLIAALFLHLGPLHLIANMMGLAFFGPFVEFALGFRRFVFVYFLAGIGSMALASVCTAAPGGEVIIVGASGCVMGLLGAAGALMLRGWLREKARAARTRLLLLFGLVAIQTAVDLFIPEISMTAHISGVLIGFAAALLFRDRLNVSVQ